MHFVMGLDLGQAVDYTALAILEQTEAGTKRDGSRLWNFAIRWLERFERGTPYTKIVEALSIRFNTRFLADKPLAVDYTGVGRPVVELLRAGNLGVNLRPILITAGARATRDDDGVYHVPKRDLVGTLQVLMDAGRLKLSAELPLARTLLKELAGFRSRVTLAGSETYAAWRASDHDDLVLAVALACWLGEESPPMVGNFY